MSEPLQVLIVEDSESDAAMVVRLLRKADYDVHDERVESADQMRAALGKQAWDVVIADYSLPQFDAPAALTLLQQVGLDIPFIVVSGTIGEDTAVAMMKAGAHDYLMKDKLTRLAPAVEREIREAQTRRERRRAEGTLRESRLLFHLLIESLPQSVFAKDLAGRFVFANQHYCATEGRTLEEIVGKTDVDLHPPELAEKYCRDDHRVIETGQTLNLEEEHQPLGKEKSFVQVIKTPLFDTGGQTSGTLGIFWDITERKRAEQALEQYSARLEAAVAQRTQELRDAQEQLVRQEKLAVLGQLASSVAHELRNPLGVIANAVYFLKAVQPNADAAILDYLGLISAEVNNADKIVTDLLDFARIKGVARETVGLAALVERALQRHPPAANITIALEYPDPLLPLFVDPHQIEQVLTNLIVNACQAMPEGGLLTLRAEVVSEPMSASPEPSFVALQVSDTGTGISPDNMPRLFEPLFTTKAKGIGLGLAVSKKLIEANGGKIEVLSEPGKGSTFTIFLPVEDRSND